MSAFAREELLGQEGCQVALAAFLFKSFGLLKPQPSRWLESGKRSQSGSLRPPRPRKGLPFVRLKALVALPP
jgi:hypothetical protein